MKIAKKEIKVESKKRLDVVNIENEISKFVEELRIKEGICFIFALHTTCGIMINENYDKNLNEDIHELLKNLIPKGKWRHDLIDNNGDAHLKSMLIPPYAIIPISNGVLALGRWQTVSLIEFDGPRERKILLIILGD